MTNLITVKTISFYGFTLFNFIDVSAKTAFEPKYTCVNDWKACYKYYSRHFDRENWEDAKAQCESDGTHLAVIRSQDDNTKVQAAM